MILVLMEGTDVVGVTLGSYRFCSSGLRGKYFEFGDQALFLSDH